MNNNYSRTHQLHWTVGFTSDLSTAPEKFVPARVPGAVQLDWADAHGWPDPHYSGDPGKYRWMEDVYWIYRTRLDFDPLNTNERLYFISKGIDYAFRVVLAGKTLLEQEGMFTPVKLDISGIAGPGDELQVIVFPVPKSHPEPTPAQADQSCKPAVSYGWDFHPRLIPSGIWDDTFLAILAGNHIVNAEVGYRVSETFESASIACTVVLNDSCESMLRWRILDREGAVVFCTESPVPVSPGVLEGTLSNPRLWWPSGQGDPYLYTSELELCSPEGRVIDTQRWRIGFRTVRLVMSPGQWEDPAVERFPKGPNKPPITLEINGRPIFAKGSNLTPLDIFPGTLTSESYRTLLESAKNANFNILRCWGGGPVQKDSFFEICDELGIMVWQEFPLACNRYEGTEAYLKVLDQESRSIITRLRRHPSVVLWCGGNELFNAWSRMTEQDHALRLLNRNCYDLDKTRPFLMTAPLYGMGHGNYLFDPDGPGSDVFRCYSRSSCTAYSEFGVPAPAPLEVLKQIIPEEERLSWRTGHSWKTHHAFGAWDASDQAWLEIDLIESYFGPVETLEKLVECGQLLQQEGLKCIFEEGRRQKPRCSMTMNWCFNEPWPTAANGSIISWPHVPKPAYHSVASALRPVLASARIPQFSWSEGEIFSCELWLLNDSPQPLDAGEIEAILHNGDRRISLGIWEYPPCKATANCGGPTMSLKIPAFDEPRMQLHLVDKRSPDRNSDYTLLFTA